MGKPRPRQGALCPQAQWAEPDRGRPHVSESQPVAPRSARWPADTPLGNTLVSQSRGGGGHEVRGQTEGPQPRKWRQLLHSLILPKTQGLAFSNPHSSALASRTDGLSSNKQLTRAQALSSFSNQTKPSSPSTPAPQASQATATKPVHTLSWDTRADTARRQPHTGVPTLRACMVLQLCPPPTPPHPTPNLHLAHFLLTLWGARTRLGYPTPSTCNF